MNRSREIAQGPQLNAVLVTLNGSNNRIRKRLHREERKERMRKERKKKKKERRKKGREILTAYFAAMTVDPSVREPRPGLSMEPRSQNFVAKGERGKNHAIVTIVLLSILFSFALTFTCLSWLLVRICLSLKPLQSKPVIA
jgi:hypothetical protein